MGEGTSDDSSWWILAPSVFEASLRAARAAHTRITDELEAGESLTAADTEVLRLRRWLAYAAENMPYDGVEEHLWRSLSDEALAFSEDTDAIPLRWQD